MIYPCPESRRGYQINKLDESLQDLNEAEVAAGAVREERGGLVQFAKFHRGWRHEGGADHREGVLQPTRRRKAPGWVCWITFSRSISYGSVGYGDGIVKAFLSALCSRRCVAVSSCMGIGASVVA
jgi:hypothetical protein